MTQRIISIVIAVGMLLTIGTRTVSADNDTRIFAYIVRAGDYSANIAPAMLKAPDGSPVSVDISNPPAFTSEDIAQGKDLILGYPHFEVVYNSAEGTYEASGIWTYESVSRDDFGIETDLLDYELTAKNRELVGLKVVREQDASYLAGTKTSASKNDISSDKKIYWYNGSSNLELYDGGAGSVSGYSINGYIIDGDLSYNNGVSRTTVKLKNSGGTVIQTVTSQSNGSYITGRYRSSTSSSITIYSSTYGEVRFTNISSSISTSGFSYDDTIYIYYTGSLTSSGGTSNATVTSISEISGSAFDMLMNFVEANGNYALEIVDNGDYDSFLIFTPYTVGYYDGKETAEDDPNESYRLDGTAPKTLHTNNPDAAKNTIIHDINKVGFDEGNAYLYTVEGRDLYIFAKLVTRIDKKYPEYILGSEQVGIGGLTINLTEGNGNIALNATTWVNNIRLGVETSAFSLTADSVIFYVYRHDDGSKPTDPKKYGVLTQAPTTIANYLGTGKLMYMYSVWTYANSRVEQFVSEVWLVDDNGYSVPKAGDIVSYQKLGDYYRVGAFDNINHLYFDFNGHGGPAGTDDFKYNANTYSLTYQPYSVTGILNGDTQILAIEKDGGAYIRTRTLTWAHLDELFINKWDSISNIEMITTHNADISTALVVLVTVPVGTFDNVYDTNSYFTITNVYDGSYGYGNSSYNLVKGYNYINGQTKNLAVDNGYNYVVGQVVKLAYERYTTFGTTTYQIAERINVNPAKIATDSTLTSSRGAYTQPSALLAYLKTLTANQLGRLNAERIITASGEEKTGATIYNGTSGVGGYFMYPLYRLANGIAYSWPYDVNEDLYCDAITRLTGNNINIITVTLNPNANPDISLVIDRSNGDFLGYFTNRTLEGGVRTTATTQWFVVANNAGNVDFTGFPTSQAQTSDIVTFVRIIDNGVKRPTTYVSLPGAEFIKDKYINGEKASRQIEIPIYIQNNPGLVNFEMTVTYDPSVLTPVNVTDGEVWKGAIISNLKYEPDKILITGAATANKTGDGNIARLVFEADENAPDGWSPLSIEITLLTTLDADNSQQPIPFNKGNGGVSVVSIMKGDVNGDKKVDAQDATDIQRYEAILIGFTDRQSVASDTANRGVDKIDVSDAIRILLYAARLIPSLPPPVSVQGSSANLLSSVGGGEISLGSESGEPGDTVKIPINISGNEGFSGFTFKINYDNDTLTPVKVENGNVLTGDIVTNLEADANGGDKCIIITGATALNTTGNGTIAYATFKIKDNAAAGTANINIDVTSLKYTDVNAGYTVKDLPHSANNGTITIGSVEPPTIPELGDLLDKLDTSDKEEVNTAAEIVRQMDATELAEAMKENDSFVEKMETLEEAYKSHNNIKVAIQSSVAEINSSQIIIKGAGLNASGGTVTLELRKPQSAVAVDDTRYKNIIRFNMTLTGADVKAGNLDVPIMITVPIPTDINPNNFRILHYYVNEIDYEEITPQLNSDGSASFVVTRFSEFVFVEKNISENGVTVRGVIRSYNPKNGTMIRLMEGGNEVDRVTIAPETGSGQIAQTFTFENVQPGTYTIEVTKAAHTKYIVNNIVAEDTDVDLTKDSRLGAQLITLVCGDVNGDGSVNSTDLNILWSGANYLKQTTGAANPAGDLDGDGNINSADLNILWSSQNYLKGNISVD